MSTIPDDLNQVVRELEKLQAARDAFINDIYHKGKINDYFKAESTFMTNVLDDAIKIISDAEERIVMLEARECLF